MFYRTFFILALCLAVYAAGGVSARAEEPRWGTAKTDPVEYAPAKVLYDVFSGDKDKLANILDRISMLQNVYDADPFNASIVVVLHGSAIPVFSLKHSSEYADLMARASSLTHSEIIEFRMCGASAKMQGYEASDIHGFVTMVPMADAEIIRLQNQGYVYMQ